MLQQNNRVRTNKVRKRILPQHAEVTLGQCDEFSLEDFKIKKSLGQGAFGAVYKVFCNRDEEIYAMKKIEKAAVINYGMEDYLRREVKLMATLNHPNIISVSSWFENEKDVFIIMEFAEKGQLFDQVKKYRRVPEDIAAPYVKQLVDALHYLQTVDKTTQILHRDIKGENILIDKHNNAKLADFGWANIKGADVRKTYCGTPEYLAPEVVLKRSHDAKVDNWAVGVLLYELLVGITPFKPDRKDPPNASLEGNILKKRVQYQSFVSQDARNFIDFVLKKDPTKRPNIVAIMGHPFWKKHKLVFKQQEEKKITIVPTLETRPEMTGEQPQLTDQEAAAMLKKDYSTVPAENPNPSKVEGELKVSIASPEPITTRSRAKTIIDNVKIGLEAKKVVQLRVKEGAAQQLAVVEKSITQNEHDYETFNEKLRKLKDDHKQLEDENMVITKDDAIYTPSDLYILLNQKNSLRGQYENTNSEVEELKNKLSFKQSELYNKKHRQLHLNYKKEEYEDYLIKNNKINQEKGVQEARQQENEALHVKLDKDMQCKICESKNINDIMKKYSLTEDQLKQSIKKSMQVNTYENTQVDNLYANLNTKFQELELELATENNYVQAIDNARVEYLKNISTYEELKEKEQIKLVEEEDKFKTEIESANEKYTKELEDDSKKFDESNIGKITGIKEKYAEICKQIKEKSKELLKQTNKNHLKKNELTFAEIYLESQEILA